MKKILFLAALPLCLAISCSTKTVEQKTQEYQEKSKAIVEAFNETYESILADESLTDEKKMELITAADEKAEADIIALGVKTVKANKDNELAIKALKDIYYMADIEVLEPLVDQLKGEVAEDAFVTKVKTSLNAKKATAEGKMYTDFQIDTQRLSDYVGNGKWVLVDFWASWCGPCKREIPNIKAVYEQYAGADFNVLSVAVWDKPEDTVRSAEEHGVVWDQIIDAQSVPTEIYGIDGIPHIILFAPDGTIAKRNLRGEGIAAAVKEALGR